MKVTLTLTAAFSILLMTGCARNTISLEKGNRQLAPMLGLEAGEIAFINHVLFAKFEEADDSDISEIRGYMALTEEELILGRGTPRSASKHQPIRIPLADLEGFAPFGPEVQVAHEGDRYLIFPYLWFSDTTNMPQVDRLMTLLEEQGVPLVDAWELEGFPSRSAYWVDFVPEESGYPRGRYIPDQYNDGGFYDGNGNPIDTIPNIPPEPRFPVQLDNSLNGTPPPYPEGRYPTTGQ